MRSKLFLVFLWILVYSLSLTAQTVVEAESSVGLTDAKADFSFSLVAATGSNTETFDLELVDAEDQIRARATQTVRMRPGKHSYKISMDLGNLMKEAADDIAWYRLRYRIGSARGIMSLSTLIAADFELRASAYQNASAGSAFRVRVRALNPYTKEPVKRVQVQASLKLDIDTDEDNDETTISATGITDGDGFVTLDMKVPADLKIDLDMDPELTIIGRKNGIKREIEEDLDSDDNEGSLFITTDKPLYQPGQNFNVRALYLDVNNVVVAKSELEFTIKDEDDTVVYRETLNTSDLGIASIGWVIPENAKLGTYRVEIDADNDVQQNEITFKVSRYDLPNFSVKTKADKTFYLPGDTTAAITVGADYLFGKPVMNGKVRVVHESRRVWNWRLQKYDVDESDPIEGTAGPDGKFVANIDIANEMNELRASQWQRFRDLSFAAYYTDATTNRTEQRRFEIRLTKEPIHIYLIRYADINPKLPLKAYLSTFYADGTPAACNLEVRGRDTLLRRFRSNELGAAKFELKIPETNVGKRDFPVQIKATDKSGRTGTFDEEFYLTDDDIVQISVEKPILQVNENILVRLDSTQTDGFLYVDLVRNTTTIDSRLVELNDGKADIEFPYRESFKGEITIVAYGDRNESYWDNSMRASRGVVYPSPQNLKVSAKFSAAQYKPNEDASVRFSILDGSGRAQESVLGVTIFDRAIEERAQTDSDFGSYFGRFSSLLGYQRGFGSVTLKDLNELSPSEPASEEMQLAAEIMLSGGYNYPRIYHSGDRTGDAAELYGDTLKKIGLPIETALTKEFKSGGEVATNEAALRRILSREGIELGTVLDPWGQPIMPTFTFERSDLVLKLISAGPDEMPKTKDDLTAYSGRFQYFASIGAKIEKLVNDHKLKTGKYIRDLETLRSIADAGGVDIIRLQDVWGRPYRISFEVSGRNYVIRFRSLGSDGILGREVGNSDDFDVLKVYDDYFYTTENEINKVLGEAVNSGRVPFPKNDAEFKKLLVDGGVPFESIVDGYGRPVYLTTETESRYVDKTTVVDGKTIITPGTAEMKIFRIRSDGEDRGTSWDDSTLATFSGAITASYRDTDLSKGDVRTVVYSGAKGAIRGTVIDPSGAVIPGADVVAIDENDASKMYPTKTNSDGIFLIANLPSGRYSVRVSSSGFSNYRSSGLQVRSQSLIEMNVTLQVGGVEAMVSVSGEPAAAVDVSSSMVSTTVTKADRRISFPYQEMTSTPRLREYFPETLVWQPELMTDKKGRAELKFKMADNITTWKMYVIASNKDGKIGVAEKEVTAFQSFFVDLDPPKFLTVGDEIFLPTQVRNYTDKRQKVDVTMARADWFSALGADKQQIDVDAGNSKNAVFGFKAATAVKAGKQRVMAIAQTDSDAIEKPVTVRPDGQEIVKTESKISGGNPAFDVNFPANALAKTQRAELKIYPNLYSHVAESVEGLLQRPYGCGEQTISSTYPNLMILKFVKPDTVEARKAKQYLQKGYERLIGYQAADGGFTYWGGKDTSDVALTAYALRFLNDAGSQVSVDAEVIKRAESWLASQQRQDGSWTKKYYYETAEDPGRTKLTTTYVTRSIAMRKGADKAVLAKALDYLKTRNAEIDEPYALALYGLASLDGGNPAIASGIAKQLEKMALTEDGAAYWNLETNTPFYGWGTAGRIETTALVLQLLIRESAGDQPDASRNDLISKGTLFLLKNKDRYGVWYSTQTTINVLDAFLASLGTRRDSGPQSINIQINGRPLEPIVIAADRIDPVSVDLTDKLNAAENRVTLNGTADSALMSQVVASHYIDWKDADVSARNVNGSRELRLDYRCDKTSPAIMEEVTCSVDAERVGFKGYGMLLVELGTPPGAEVSRESLQAAIDADWTISRYDVLPDRVVLYMWSKAGGTKFDFKFKPRYGINAQTPSSIVYDYYNPEAQAVVAPLRFTAK